MLHVLYIMINISCPRKRIKNRGKSRKNLVEHQMIKNDKKI